MARTSQTLESNIRFHLSTLATRKEKKKLNEKALCLQISYYRLFIKLTCGL